MPNTSAAARLVATLFSAVLACAFVSTAAAKPATGATVKGYDYYLVGSAANVTVADPIRPSVVLMGGGPDVDAAFAFMIGKAGGGDFVVIRASGADGYNPYIFAMGNVDSVETLVIKTREAAFDPFVLERVAKADALFIAGGDQSDYIRLWKGTPLEEKIKALQSRNVPIGGTSAGLAVLGEFDYTGAAGSVTSAEALANPYNRRMTLDRDFLTAPGLGGVIADAHLDTRDRMGRLLTFVARIVQDGWVTTVDAARGIGVDVETALLIDGDVATRVGLGSVYFLRPAVAPVTCKRGTPLTFRSVGVDRLSGSGSFSLGTWSGAASVTHYDISAEAGVLISSQQGGSVY